MDELILVIDEGTTPLISAACDMYDIIAENISSTARTICTVSTC